MSQNKVNVKLECNQAFVIEGKYIKIVICSNYTKKFNEIELILLASQIIKAYSNKILKTSLEKLGVI